MAVKKAKKAPRAKASNEIRLDPKNLRRHPERNQEVIRKSLEEVGPFRSIAIDGDNIVRAGNGVFEQAQALGLKIRVVDAEAGELIAVKRSDLKGDKAIRAAILDNRSGELSEWDYEEVSKLLQRWNAEGLDVKTLGWADYELSPLLSADWQPPAVGDMPTSGKPGAGSVAVAFTKAQFLSVARAIAVVRKLREDASISEADCLVFICQEFLTALKKK